MFVQLYTAASGMINDGRALELVSHNLSNVRTPGFRAERPIFSSVTPPEPLRRAGVVPMSPRSVSLSQTWRSDEPGSLRETGSPFDFALRGKGWFRVETDNGERLTRDGSFTRNASGQLTTLRGEPVLDWRGQPIELPQGTLRISPVGDISVDEQFVGKLGIASGETELEHEGNSLWRPTGPIEQAGTFDLAQGFLENSGVSATDELMTMIHAQRMFQMQQKVVDLTVNGVARQALDLAGVE